MSLHQSNLASVFTNHLTSLQGSKKRIHINTPTNKKDEAFKIQSVQPLTDTTRWRIPTLLLLKRRVRLLTNDNLNLELPFVNGACLKGSRANSLSARPLRCQQTKQTNGINSLGSQLQSIMFQRNEFHWNKIRGVNKRYCQNGSTMSALFP